MKDARLNSKPRRAANVTMRVDLVTEARLEVLVKEARAAQWRKDNQKAIAAYARYVEKHGIWNEEERGW